MRTYRALSQAELAISDADWETLTGFVSDAQSQITAMEGTEQIESPPPKIQTDSPSEPDRFHPGGWVGTYPGEVRVYPGKLNRFEYEYLLKEVAGWFEVWDIPTAGAVMPLVNAEMIDSRSVVLGYSEALITFTEEALAHRPPTKISRETTVGTTVKGPLNIQETIASQARGRQAVASDEVTFSFAHPINLLLVRFHLELAQELSDLLGQSYVMTDTLAEHKRYHQGFLEREFGDSLLDAALEQSFRDPAVLDEILDTAPQGLAELVELWESYLRDQTLSIDFSEQLTIGVKPVEKMYELWVLKIILDIASTIVDGTVAAASDSFEEFQLGDIVSLYYNTALEGHSEILAQGLGSNPGRPDYAIEVDDEIRWVGDAKFRYESGIGLEDYQRFLSYAVDLMQFDTEPSGTIIFSGDDRAQSTTVNSDMTLKQLPLRPKRSDGQRKQLESQLQSCLAGV